MRISEKEWDNISFRKNKYNQLKEALDEAMTGRDNKVSAFALCEEGRYSLESLDKFVGELVRAMEEYGDRNHLWIRGDNNVDDDDVAHMPDKFNTFVNYYLYCIIRLILCDMDWISDILVDPLEDSFQQILSHAVNVRKLAAASEEVRFDELWNEAYYHSIGEGGVFDAFTIAFEALTDDDIRNTLTPEMEAKVEEYCRKQNATFDEFVQDAVDGVMSDEEIEEALARSREDHQENLEQENLNQKNSHQDNYYPEGYDRDACCSDEEIEWNRKLDNMYSMLEKGEENFKKKFVDAGIFCERYICMREILYMASERNVRCALEIFDNLVEGMLDVFLCRRGMSLYVDVKKFIRSYTYIKKQIGKIKELREEV